MKHDIKAIALDSATILKRRHLRKDHACCPLCPCLQVLVDGDTATMMGSYAKLTNAIVQIEKGTSNEVPSLCFFGAPDTIRTCDFYLRRVALYPAELRALGSNITATAVVT